MKTVILIAFYNKKALGVRYLQTALENAGYRTIIVFFKDFNSKHPQPVMNFGIDYVIRGDGEINICLLADAIKNNTDYENIPSLCFRRGGEIFKNEMGNILNSIDDYGLPTINSREARFIEHDKIIYGDPQLSTRSYEVIASRGCPFTCSYCCCNNLRKMLPRGIKGVRTRSVKSVIEELIEAKKQCGKLSFIHFYDEIFPNLPGWVDEFVEEYKKHINMPFTIWSHPKMVDEEVLRKLKSVGLTEVIMGIQSGSDRIRSDIFHRYETRDDIINSVNAIKDAKIFWCSFDFMLMHPFEETADLKDTYYLVKDFRSGFELQLHGLNFLPGTDICDMAVNSGKLTSDELEKIMYAPMNEQFDAYWHQNNSEENDLWYKMTFCLQFTCTKRAVTRCEADPVKHAKKINRLYSFAKRLEHARYFYKKGRIMLTNLLMRK